MSTPATLSGLDGLRTIVTGATAGIGEGIARDLAAAGARVMMNCHSDPGGGEAIAAEIRAAGGEAVVACADVGDEAEVARLFDATREAFGAVDLLVNNAGIQADAPLLQMSVGDWDKVLAVNLTGQFLCAREAAREFLREDREPPRRRSRGHIICMSSVHETIPWAGRVNYAASKGGILMLMETLAQELAPEGIRVNGVAPGAIRTRINREAWETEEARRDLLALIPYGRIGEVEDVARVVRWLAAEDSDYVTGASLYVDGGMTLYPGFREGG